MIFCLSIGLRLKWKETDMSIYGSEVKFVTGLTLETPWRVNEFYYPSEVSYVTVPWNFDHGIFYRKYTCDNSCKCQLFGGSSKDVLNRSQVAGRDIDENKLRAPCLFQIRKMKKMGKTYLFLFVVLVVETWNWYL